MDYALKSIKLRADSGDIEANIELGKRYLNGDGVKAKINKAEKYFKKAASLNSAEGYIELGKLYRDNNNSELAEKMWTKAASLGSDEAMCLVASLYYEKGRIARNIDKAVWWLEKPANRGYAPAQLALGYLYYKKGKDEREILKARREILKAREWFKKAAEHDVAEAQFMYGCLLCGDKEMQPAEALMEGEIWLKKAARNGYAKAYYELGNIYAYAYDEKFIDIAKAEEAFLAAIKAGFYEATTALGAFYCDNGKLEKGVALYTEAAEDGNKIAMSLLGDLYFEGNLVGRDFDKAFYWYSREFDIYSEPSYYGLGKCYLYGAGVERNEKKAVKYLRTAAKYVSDAYYELGNCYYNGWGVNQNKDEAKRIWESLDGHEEAEKALEKYFGIKVKEED